MKKTVLSILITLLIGTALWRMPVFAEQISDEEFAVLEEEELWTEAAETEADIFPEDSEESEPIVLPEEETADEPVIFSDEEIGTDAEMLLEEGYCEADNDELLYQYLDRELLGAEPQPVKLRSADLGSKLSDPNSIIYEALKQNAQSIASGEQESTIISVSMKGSSLYYADKEKKTRRTWSAKSLGIESIGTIKEDGSFEAASDFKEAFYRETGYSMSKVMISLLRDSPYEMFWFGKNYSSTVFYKIYQSKTDGSLYAVIPDQVKVSIYTSPDYAVEGEGAVKTLSYTDKNGNTVLYDPFTVNTERIDAVNSAIENAKQIVAENTCSEDYDTLFYYFSEVGSLSAYNSAAVSTVNPYPGGYGDPWQVIYLFDGDPSTKVVCEGFSKGMQYLCDMTEFEDDRIYCYCVTGDLISATTGTNRGFHMWNIVHMNDGYNYMIDATNSKESDPWAFLAPYSGGNVRDGYIVGGRYKYVYDDEYTRLVYSEEELTLSGMKYVMPKRPSALTAAASDEAIVLNWECEGEPAGYRISRSEDGRVYFDVGQVRNGSVHTWLDEDAPGGLCYYRVCSYAERDGAEIESSFSEPVSVWFLKAPGLQNLTNSKSAVKMEWSATEGADGYKIYYSVNGSKFSWLKTVRSPSVLSWTGLGKVTESGDVIKIKIRAYKTVDGTVCYSPYSKTGTLIRLQRRTIANVYNTASCVALSWNRDKAADGYLVYRSVNGGEYKLVRTVTANKTVKWTDTAASKTGKRYTYKVLSYKKLDGVRYCSYPSAAVKTYRVPRPAVSSLKKTESGIRISWDKTETADGYYIYRSVNGGSFKKIKDVTSGKAGTYTDKKATKKDTKYTYHIVAYNTVSGKQYVSYRSKNKSMKIR